MYTTNAEWLQYALDRLDKATKAYDLALDGMRLVQTNTRRVEAHNLDALLASLKYWQDRVNYYQSLTGVVTRPNINPPLTYNL